MKNASRIGLGLVGVLVLSAVACAPASGSDGTGAEQAIGTAPSTAIKHVVVIVQENHSFDAYFGKYCKAETGSKPDCHEGADCCEAAPSKMKSAHGVPLPPEPLNDATNIALDRNHGSECEYYEMHCSDDDYGAIDATAPGATGTGECKMDRYVDFTAWGEGLCGRIGNYAAASPDTVKTYVSLAQQGAIGDNYFQPIIGQTSSNDMFLARAQFEFKDNGIFPERPGSDCQIKALPDKPKKGLYKNKKTIADLLLDNDPTAGFGYYHVGYAAAQAAGSGCAEMQPEYCPARLRVPGLKVACLNDPSDDPFKYYAQFPDDSPFFHDYDDLSADVAAKKLPSVVYVKATTGINEHPAFSALSDGQAFVQKTIDTIMGSPYAKDTLVLVTWDEGGGYYDHVSPPIAPDGRRYGTRVPIIAVGKFARKADGGYVSHVQMEHSSIVKFLEWNFLGKKTGQLGGREDGVKNIGSLLDPALGVPDGE